MVESPTTRASLLLRVRNAQDEAAWRRFAGLYAPLVADFLRRRGLQPHDADDVAQEALLAVATALRGFDYDPQRGRFRGWLFTIVHNKFRSFLTRRKKQVLGSGDSAMLERLEAEAGRADEQQAAWDRAYEQQLFAWAAEQVRPRVAAHNWEAFWSTAVEGKTPAQVAAQLRLSVPAVRLAKSRVMAQIRKTIEEADPE